MGWTKNLITGLAEHLADDGVGVWRPDGPAYAPSEIGISVGSAPPAPDLMILLNPYPVDSHVSQADVTIAVQIRTRGDADPRTVLDIDDAVFESIHGLTHILMGGVNVVQIYRRSASPMGRDKSDREEYGSNYYIDAMRPTAARPY